MKLIITENQFKNIVENKLEKFKEKILQGVGDNGIYHTARELGMSTNDLIRQFGLELKDKKITDVIDFYMDNRFDKNYNFIEKGSLCESYGNSETFLNKTAGANGRKLSRNLMRTFICDCMLALRESPMMLRAPSARGPNSIRS